MCRTGNTKILFHYLSALPSSAQLAAILAGLTSDCSHARTLRLCNICRHPWVSHPCRASDPAILVVCLNCPYQTLA